MTSDSFRDDLHGYLRGAQDTLVWSLHGLGEYDIRPATDPDWHQPFSA